MTRTKFAILAACAVATMSLGFLAWAAAAPSSASPIMVEASAPAAVVPAEPKMRALFTWTGAHTDAWRSSANWTSPGTLGYPDDTNDDALIDAFDSANPFEIGLSADTTIDDLTVTEDDATPLRITNGSAVTLTCDTITISCTDSSGFVRLIAHDRVKIETN